MRTISVDAASSERQNVIDLSFLDHAANSSGEPEVSNAAGCTYIGFLMAPCMTVNLRGCKIGL